MERHRVAAAAYTLAGIASGLVVAFVVPRVAPEGAPLPPPLLLFCFHLVVMAFLAFWVFRGVRWLTRILAVVTAGHAAQHLLCFVWPTKLYWTVKFLPESMLLADGSRHVGYLVSAGFLILAAVCLKRAGWPPPEPAVTSPPPAPAAPSPR